MTSTSNRALFIPQKKTGKKKVTSVLVNSRDRDAVFAHSLFGDTLNQIVNPVFFNGLLGWTFVGNLTATVQSSTTFRCSKFAATLECGHNTINIPARFQQTDTITLVAGEYYGMEAVVRWNGVSQPPHMFFITLQDNVYHDMGTCSGSGYWVSIHAVFRAIAGEYVFGITLPEGVVDNVVNVNSLSVKKLSVNGVWSSADFNYLIRLDDPIRGVVGMSISGINMPKFYGEIYYGLSIAQLDDDCNIISTNANNATTAVSLFKDGQLRVGSSKPNGIILPNGDAFTVSFSPPITVCNLHVRILKADGTVASVLDVGGPWSVDNSMLLSFTSTT